MSHLDQSETPFLTALDQASKEIKSPFDVPGHHLGNISTKAVDVIGHRVYECDVNAPLGMDNLAQPRGVILQSERLLADACGADDAFFLVNGTTGGILAMFLAALKANDKVILPRNVHKSVINSLILCGAIPIYVMPEIDDELNIANQPSLKDWEKAMRQHPSAKAIFVINPTYFGAVGPLKELVALAHAHGMAVLVDEAHGAHYYFHGSRGLCSAMDAGADLSSASFHKTAGSLTQSSVLLMHYGFFTREDIQKSLNVLTTTSPSSILMASIDGARSYMASEKGKEDMERVYLLSDYARSEIAKIDGFYDVSREHFIRHGAYDYDVTKLVIGLDRLDISGFDLYRILREKYEIQMELAESHAVLGILAIGTKKEHIDRLIDALREIGSEHFRPEMKKADPNIDLSFPFMLIRPRTAFHAPGKVLPLNDLDGEISKEQVMMYPPGIPLICPGEVWTKDLIRRVKGYEACGVKTMSSYTDGFEVVDTRNWKRFRVYEKKLGDYLESKITTPREDGYRLPFEGQRHDCVFVLAPYRADTWREGAEPAVNEIKRLVEEIARFEPVVVGIHPSHYKRLAPRFQGIENVKTISIRYNDSWARDIFPFFLNNGKKMRTLDFRFNAWGGDVDGLYKNYRDDDRISEIISKRMKLRSYYLNDFVLEGGSVVLDGEGTLITTEACLLSKGRNPTLSKAEIEDRLMEYFNVEKVIWLPHGIYQDETNEHADNMVAFARPGELFLAWSDDLEDPQYEYSHDALAILKNERDAKGRNFKIHFLRTPSPALRMSEAEARGLKKERTTLDVREGGRRLAASYVNFIQGEDYAIIPGFGVKEDRLAHEEFERVFPEKEIIQIPTREILLGGGNIHCLTMGVASIEEKK